MPICRCAGTGSLQGHWAASGTGGRAGVALPAHRFVRRQRAGGRRIVLFFYFQEGTRHADVDPGVHGEGDVARFHLTGGLTDRKELSLWSRSVLDCADNANRGKAAAMGS